MASDGLSWNHYFGSDESWQEGYQGSINTTVSHDGGDQAAKDRFNGGDGMKMEGAGNWLDQYGDTLVFYFASDDATGVGEAGNSPQLYGAGATPAHDDLLEDAGYQTLSFDTLNELLADRVIFSASKDGASDPVVAISVGGGENLEAVIINDTGTAYLAGGDTTLSAGSYHTLSIAFDGTELSAIVDGTKESTTKTPAGSLDGLDVARIGNIKRLVEEKFFDDRIGAIAIFIGRTLGVEERKRLHNWFKLRGYDALSFNTS